MRRLVLSIVGFTASVAVLHSIRPSVAAVDTVTASQRDTAATEAGPAPAPAPAANAAHLVSFLDVQGDRIVDAQDRQVLLHGLNIISKSKAENYLSWHRAADIAALRVWGMNCIRLGILWDGIEPKPGQYDETYLDGVADRVAWAAAHGIHVFLDMHQDLFSVRYSDGAPEWATLHEGKPHERGAVWSDSYLTSPAVQTAFDNFWANAPAADGIGIQDHYAAAWRHVAERFANNPTVLGYDLMNEPFEGTSVLAAHAALLQSDFAKRLAQRLGGSIQSPEQIAALWLDPNGRSAITKQLEDMGIYRAFVDAQQEHSQAFEISRLRPMYARVARAIREVDSRHALLLESSYHCNAGVSSGIEPIVDPGGERDPRQVFAPHGYDIVVDTPDLASGSSARVEFIFQRHAATAERLGMPMIVGEWGAFGGADARIVPSARFLQRQFERLLCGDTYWDYGRAIQDKAYFVALKRSIPSRIAGRLLAYEDDWKTRTFTCRWNEAPDISAPTIVYLTAATFSGATVRLEPPGRGFRVQPAAAQSHNVYVSIPPTGKRVERTLIVKQAANRE